MKPPKPNQTVLEAEAKYPKTNILTSLSLTPNENDAGSMRSSALTFTIFRILLGPAIIATLLLYLYPAVQNCHFPVPSSSNKAATKSEQCIIRTNSSNGDSAQRQTCSPRHTLPKIAPFRLLSLGDPQLEGDSSLPKPNAPKFPSLYGFGHRLTHSPASKAPSIIKQTFQSVGAKDLPKLLKGYRKRLDLLGNDYYLAHVYRLMSWWTQPTHTVVLGDLLGSQWISDAEFEVRAKRFWERVFVGVGKVEDEIMDPMAGLDVEDGETAYSERVEVMAGPEYEAWKERLIVVAGNHDIGYAGDINHRRIQRFENRFGRVNWNLRFVLPDDIDTAHPNATEDANADADAEPSDDRPPPPVLELIILNDMNLDRPAWHEDLRQTSWSFLDESISRIPHDSSHATILLTHIPLYKPAGVCVDGPFFDYFPEGQGGGIREQNHLSWLTSRIVLDGLFGGGGVGDGSGKGMGKGGIILNGHDHEGCDIYHHIPLSPSLAEEEEGWTAEAYASARRAREDAERRGVREVTVRSMMGEYWGNAGLLSAWFDHEDGVWRFEFENCVLGVQHFWWAVHVVDLVTVLIGLAAAVAWGLETLDANMGKRNQPVKPLDGKEALDMNKDAKGRSIHSNSAPDANGDAKRQPLKSLESETISEKIE